jgi:hypothetical protein
MEAVAELLTQCAYVDYENKLGQTAMMAAIMGGQESTTAELLRHGGAVNVACSLEKNGLPGFTQSGGANALLMQNQSKMMQIYVLRPPIVSMQTRFLFPVRINHQNHVLFGLHSLKAPGLEP